MCTALQLTNFWQDLAIDWPRGRLYVPEEVWRGAGADPALLDRGRMTPEWTAAMRACGERTRRLFADGRPVCDGVSGRLRYELRATWLGGTRILDRLEAVNFDVFTSRPALGTVRRISDSVWHSPVAPAPWHRHRGTNPWAPIGTVRTLGTRLARDTSFLIPSWSCRTSSARPLAWCGTSAARSTMRWMRRRMRRRRRWRLRSGGPRSAACLAPRRRSTPQGQHLKPLVAAFSLSRPPFDDLVDGVEMDLRHKRYQTFDELSGYCRRVASTVGLICIEIFGARDSRSRDYAFNLGLALQLTNIIRDVAVDLKNGRVYLPQEDLARFGVTEADLRAGTVTAPIRRLLAHQCQRARQFYTAAAQAMPHADAHRLVAAEIMGGIYFEILQRIERRGFDVFTEVIRVPKVVRARIALSIWARGQLSALGYRLFSRA